MSSSIFSPLWIQQQAQTLSGKRLLRSEIQLSEIEFEYLLSTAQLTPIPSILKSKLTNECHRCYNEDMSKFGTIPCALCGLTHLYCRNCIQMGHITECQPLYEWTGSEPGWEVNPEPLTWEGKLSSFQQEAAEVAVSAIRNGQAELLLWAVCGAGKTEMLFPGVAEALMNGKRVCLASPRTDVVRELLPRFREAFAETNVQALYGGSPDKTADSQLILATTHQLLRFRNAFEVLIIDEVDAFPYHNDLLLHKVSAIALKSSGSTIYLTATPRKAHIRRIKHNQLPHHFIPCRFHGHPLPVPKPQYSLFLSKAVQKGLPPQSFFRWLKRRNTPERQLLIFVPTIKFAEKMHVSIHDLLLESDWIHSNKELESVHSEDPDREKKVLAFRSRQIQIMITTTILERGVTFPSVDVAVIDAGHDVFDEAALVQIAGRAGRSSADPKGEVVFFHNGMTDAMERAIHSIEMMNKRGGFGI